MSILTEPVFWCVVAIILLALALTVQVFRRRMFEPGDRKGVAADPSTVRSQNPPTS
jgi:hypothetical protein